MLKHIIRMFILLAALLPSHSRRHPHIIDFQWPDLYPPSFAWDAKSDHFIVGSLRQCHLISVSDAGVASLLSDDSALLPNSSFLGVSLDPRHHRLLAVVNGQSPPFSALASYHLPTFRRLFLAPLNGLLPSTSTASNVAADYFGNAYVTDSANDVVYKVTEQGEATVLSKSPAFKTPTDRGGLNGVVYNTNGYLLIAQASTGRLFKVNADDGTARRVNLNREVTGASGIAVWSDGVVLAVAPHKLYFIKSGDSWSHGVVFDEIALESERQAGAVVVGAEERVYILYGHTGKGKTGNLQRDQFSIVQVESAEAGKEEHVWAYLLLGLAFTYFIFWRFHMRLIVQTMYKKMN